MKYRAARYTDLQDTENVDIKKAGQIRLLKIKVLNVGLTNSYLVR